MASPSSAMSYVKEVLRASGYQISKMNHLGEEVWVRGEVNRRVTVESDGSWIMYRIHDGKRLRIGSGAQALKVLVR